MTERRTRIAIFSVSAGAGHVRAAQAIEAAAGAWFPEVEATHVDVLTLVSRAFRKTYADGYLQVVARGPAVWGYLYTRTDRAATESRLNRVRQAIERLSTRRFEARLRELDPDIVICTHFLPAQLLSRMLRKGTFDRPVWVQVTDFDFHASWIHERMTGYLAADEGIGRRMVERGIPPEAIRVTGIPVMPVFGSAPRREACAAELGLDPSRPTVLLLAGSAGVTSIGALVDRLLPLDERLQIIALAGRSESMLADLRRRAAAAPGRLVPLGFTSTIERVMACADVAVTKPGGLTTSECLALGLPMIVVSPIPGQEERNAAFLLANGAGLQADSAEELAGHVSGLLAEPARLASLAANARRLGRPDAGRRVVEAVLGREQDQGR
ncbi:MAG TPA: glycosyltransferase [Candidatus Limnocylindrales bacterium]|nr:glycosyltransferase [Candidatus Limnocylindrales bacterium]